MSIFKIIFLIFVSTHTSNATSFLTAQYSGITTTSVLNQGRVDAFNNWGYDTATGIIQIRDWSADNQSIFTAFGAAGEPCPNFALASDDYITGYTISLQTSDNAIVGLRWFTRGSAQIFSCGAFGGADKVWTTEHFDTDHYTYDYLSGWNIAMSGGYIDAIQFQFTADDESKPPTKNPSNNPTKAPTSPSLPPSNMPSYFPSVSPSKYPSRSPTNMPIATKNPSLSPSNMPSKNPSRTPTKNPSFAPSEMPTYFPSAMPSKHPSLAPSVESKNPSISPSRMPSGSPSGSPSKFPTDMPSVSPTYDPTVSPVTASPTQEPTAHPTVEPTTSAPTVIPSTSREATVESETSTTDANNGSVQNDGSDDGFLGGNVIYVVIGCIAVFICIVIIALIICRKRRKNKANRSTNMGMTGFAVHSRGNVSSMGGMYVSEGDDIGIIRDLDSNGQIITPMGSGTGRNDHDTDDGIMQDIETEMMKVTAGGTDGGGTGTGTAGANLQPDEFIVDDDEGIDI